MPKKNCVNRAWNLLRVALMLWTRKGGVFKRRLAMELRLGAKYLKSLGHRAYRDQIHYGERELTFDKTPIFHVKMHRPASMRFLFPCIGAEQVDFDYDFGDDGVYGYDSGRKSFLKGEAEEEEYGYDCCEQKAPGEEEEEEEEIDSKAEAFIAKFYEQIKLQRQFSYLQYTEMLNRGAS
ncbi:hypothetical protein SLEP1_g1433 [Rubroshorea leprosula]|uniref:Uncharacterized protein n=1 Tax=Rubroshorea leprosula TaxID=152421 RepID=A0AAV5HJJ9_9ROSI|nr:hypothetical protein SLEP1_g1433 [Rubroshorea leprosula]